MDCHLYLTGYRGTGKTSVGAILSKLLQCQAIDLDDLIEKQVGTSIREIFQSGGEARFRDLESEALEAICRTEGAVVSLGGGAILRSQNRQRIRATGVCVWLDADPQTLADRVGGDAATSQRRPALTDHANALTEIRQVLAQRRKLYQQASDYRIDTSEKSVEQVAAQIVGLIPTPIRLPKR